MVENGPIDGNQGSPKTKSLMFSSEESESLFSLTTGSTANKRFNIKTSNERFCILGGGGGGGNGA